MYIRIGNYVATSFMNLIQITEMFWLSLAIIIHSVVASGECTCVVMRYISTSIVKPKYLFWYAYVRKSLVIYT